MRNSIRGSGAHFIYCKYRLLLIGNPGYLSSNLFPVQLLLDSTCPDLDLIYPLLIYGGANQIKAACLKYLSCSQSVPLAEIYIAIGLILKLNPLHILYTAG
jgi:hypothetical protein